MKKIILLLVIIFSISGCIIMPSRLSPHEKRLWIHQNYPRQYYYQTHPNYYKKINPQKRYKGYFRPGRW
jgi:uncharacterized protein YceK